MCFAQETRKTVAVDDVSLSLRAGETLAILGESGSGKSTIAKAIPRLLPPEANVSGKIYFDGQDILRLPGAQLPAVRGRHIGFMPQEPMTSLNPLHTIGRQVTEAVTLHKTLSTPEQKARLEALFSWVGYTEGLKRLNAFPHQISGGQRQRILAAIALAANPKLLIADEPTTALDASTQAAFLDCLADIQNQTGLAILLITHHLGVAAHYSHRVLVMQHGQVIEDGPPDLLQAPKHPYTKRLAASLPTKNAPAPTKNGKQLLKVQNLNVFPSPPTPLLESLKRLLPGYAPPKSLVNKADFALDPGQTLGILGESGAGKTSLAKGLLRLMHAKGHAVFNDQPWLALPLKRLRTMRFLMQYIFQDPFGSLNPRLLIQDIIGEGLAVHTRLPAKERQKAVTNALDQVDLPAHFANRYPHELSGGQRQRVAIARAFILKPKLIILDEPTSSLDLATQADILSLLTRLQAQEKTAYIIISHDLGVLRQLCHQVLLMKNGNIVERGSAADFFKKPETIYGQDLLAASEKLMLSA